MLWIKAFHIIFMVSWFAGLFYLPRLFVYHASAKDEISNDRFKVMERRLYYGIMWPTAILTTVFGFWLILLAPKFYLTQGWLHVKLILVGILWGYHLQCGHYVKTFKKGQNSNSHFYYRLFNEFPLLLLAAIVILAVVKPF